MENNSLVNDGGEIANNPKLLNTRSATCTAQLPCDGKTLVC